MTPLQFSVMDKLIRAGANAGVVTALEDVKQVFDTPRM